MKFFQTAFGGGGSDNNDDNFPIFIIFTVTIVIRLVVNILSIAVSLIHLMYCIINGRFNFICIVNVLIISFKFTVWKYSKYRNKQN